MSCVASVFGSKPGVLASARILPVDGSIATTAPCCPPRPATAAACAAALIVVSTAAPSGLRPVMRSRIRVKKSRSPLPVSSAFGRLLQLGLAVDDRVEAGDRGVRGPVGVLPLVAVGVVDGRRGGDRRTADHDGSAGVAVLPVEAAHVAGVVVQLVGLDVLHPGRAADEDDEHGHDHGGEPAQRGVHDCLPMTSVGWSPPRSTGTPATGVATRTFGAGRRASSEIRRSSATMTQLATSDEPP